MVKELKRRIVYFWKSTHIITLTENPQNFNVNDILQFIISIKRNIENYMILSAL